MRSNMSWMMAPALTLVGHCRAAPIPAIEAIEALHGELPLGAYLIAVFTVIVAGLLLVLVIAIYLNVASLYPLVVHTGAEAEAREAREENARIAVAKASADLHVALSDLHEEMKLARLANHPPEAATHASAPASDDPGALRRTVAPFRTSARPAVER